MYNLLLLISGALPGTAAACAGSPALLRFQLLKTSLANLFRLVISMICSAVEWLGCLRVCWHTHLFELCVFHVGMRHWRNNDGAGNVDGLLLFIWENNLAGLLLGQGPGVVGRYLPVNNVPGSSRMETGRR